MSSLASGFDDQSSVPDYLTTFPGGIEDHWILIARLDSSAPQPDSPTVRSAIADFAGEARWSDAGLLTPGRSLAPVVADGKLFFGFDEVVIFDQQPSALSPPPVAFTTDRPWTADTHRALASYLDDHHALAAAGDGAGLRWIRRGS